jgi:uncharacterized protein YabN with tetrapyrrole methylase and pyrophosphatase domain
MTPIERLRDIMVKLRDPQTGCRWDIEQSFKSIAAFTLEEAYEVVDAIEREDTEDLKDELGDLLLQVIFHAQIASEQNLFNFDDVAQAISDKMLRRHPHVFGEVTFACEDELKASWEAIKAEERLEKRARKAARAAVESSAARSLDQPSAQRSAHSSHEPTIATAAGSDSAGALDGIAMNLPALKRADKIQSRAARVGFDWPDMEPVWQKLAEEISEVKAALDQADRAAIEDEVGDLLFTVVNLARHLRVDSESALRQASGKFEKRFRRVESLAADEKRSLAQMSLAELDTLWERAKSGE